MTKNVLRKPNSLFRTLPKLLLTCCLLYCGTVMAQNARVYQEKTTLAKVVASLQQQFPQTNFSYNQESFEKVKIEKVQAEASSLNDLLELLKKQTGLHALIDGKNVTFKYIPVTTTSPPAKKDPGKVTGKVIDEDNGQPVAGANVMIGGKGVTTDIDGSFSISLPKGTYTATISHVGYGTKEISGIEPRDNQVFSLNTTLKPEKGQLAGVVVKASAKKETVAALYVRQKNAIGISDGISAEQIQRTPDKNIGEVLKRVSGLATMDNKYMVVRGLSERYNSASINGQIMPSTELNRKNFSFDIIPANMVDYVIVYKTNTPDQSAEFGGGNVNVETKTIPTENFLSLTAGVNVNDQTTGKTFLSQQLSGREYFGLPSKSRYLLGKLNWQNTREIMNQTNWNGQYGNASAYTLKDNSAVSNNWIPYERAAHPSQNYQLSIGRVIALKNDRQLGFIGSVSYRNNLQTQRVAVDRSGFKDKSEFPVIDNDHSYGFTTNTGVLLGAGFSSQKHKLSFQTMYLGLLDQQLILGTGYDAERGNKAMSYNDLTTYTRLWQNQLKGEHAIGQRGIKLKWLGSYTLLDRQRPDNHQMEAPINPEGLFPSNEFTIRSGYSRGVSTGALRWWSRAYEKNFNWDVQLSVPFRLKPGNITISNTLKTGYAGWRKDRLFYVLNTGSGTSSDRYRPIDEVFSTKDTTFFFNFSKFSDDFHKTANLHAGYIMFDTRIAEKLRLVWGVRGEYYNMNSVNQALDELEIAINRDRGQALGYYNLSNLKNREPNLNFFPSANLTYSLTPKMGLRLAYSKSIIRPDLREMAYMQEYDFELGGIFNSNVVKSSTLDHYDLRYEWYPGPGEVVSASLFSKKIHYPMEITEFDGVNRLYQLKNNKEARNKGFEIEIRKSLSFTKVPVIKNLTLYGNFTYLDAYVIPMDINLNALDANNPLMIVYEEKVAEKQRRAQTGASNYMYNAGVYFDSKTFALSMVYNHVSHRVFRPSNLYAASLFEQPLNSLDAQIAFRLPRQHIEVRLNVANLLNNFSLIYWNRYDDGKGGTALYPLNDIHKDPTTKQLAYDAKTDIINYKASPGRTYGLSVTYKL